MFNFFRCFFYKIELSLLKCIFYLHSLLIYALCTLYIGSNGKNYFFLLRLNGNWKILSKNIAIVLGMFACVYVHPAPKAVINLNLCISSFFLFISSPKCLCLLHQNNQVQQTDIRLFAATCYHVRK